jgi:GDP-L-fucose synthase
LAAFVGGIGLNKRRPAELTLKNMAMAVNMYTAIEENLHKIKNVYNVLSVCGYPANCQIPFKEEDLFKNREEKTNLGYSFAKKALLVLGEKFRDQYGLNSVSFLPANLYGSKDHFDLENSHVVPALVRKVCEAKYYNKTKVTAWGTGRASRDFLHVTDCSKALVSAVVNELNTPLAINLGTGVETSIHELVNTLCELVHYTGKIEYDCKNPDGQARRCLDITRAKELLGFEANIGLREGLVETIKWYQENLFEKDMGLVRTGKIDFLNEKYNYPSVSEQIRIDDVYLYKNSSSNSSISTKESESFNTDQVKEAAEFIKESMDEKPLRWYYNINTKEVYQNVKPKTDTDNELCYLNNEVKFDGYYFTDKKIVGFNNIQETSESVPRSVFIEGSEKHKPLKFDKTFSIEEALKRAGIEKTVTPERLDELKTKKEWAKKIEQEKKSILAHEQDPENNPEIIKEEKSFVSFKTKDQLDSEFNQAKNLFNKEIKPLDEIAINSKRGVYAVPVSPKNVSEVEIMAHLKLPPIQKPKDQVQEKPINSKEQDPVEQITTTLKSTAKKYLPRIKVFLSQVKKAAKEITKD